MLDPIIKPTLKNANFGPKILVKPNDKIVNKISITVRNNKSFLKSDNNEVLIPDQFEKLTEFILKKEYITEKLLTLEFKNIPKKDILECIESLKNMKVLY